MAKNITNTLKTTRHPPKRAYTTIVNAPRAPKGGSTTMANAPRTPHWGALGALTMAANAPLGGAFAR